MLAQCNANRLGFQLRVMHNKQRFLKREIIQAVMPFKAEYRWPRGG